jgi:hypothetical protein
LELTYSYLFYVFFSGFDHVDKQQRIYSLLSDSRISKGSTIKEANVSFSIAHYCSDNTDLRQTRLLHTAVARLLELGCTPSRKYAAVEGLPVPGHLLPSAEEDRLGEKLQRRQITAEFQDYMRETQADFFMSALWRDRWIQRL